MKITRTTNRQRVLDSFALYGANGQELSIGDIAKASGLTRTQVHGAAWSLAKEGYLHHASEGVYVLASTKPLVTVPAATPPRQEFLIPDVEWPMQEQNGTPPAPVVVVQRDIVPPVAPEPATTSSAAIGLAAFLTEQFHLDPTDVDLALAFYDRFVAGQEAWNNRAVQEEGK